MKSYTHGFNTGTYKDEETGGADDKRGDPSCKVAQGGQGSGAASENKKEKEGTGKSVG